jgi:hypothetical protein
MCLVSALRAEDFLGQSVSPAVPGAGRGETLGRDRAGRDRTLAVAGIPRKMGLRPDRANSTKELYIGSNIHFANPVGLCGANWRVHPRYW